MKTRIPNVKWNQEKRVTEYPEAKHRAIKSTKLKKTRKC